MNAQPFLARAAALASTLLFVLAVSPAAQADEGMWTFDNFPSARVARQYGFGPSRAWLDHVRMASLRIAQGCSASFISPSGLVMTNHHCVLECVQQLSTPQRNLVETGFVAKSLEDETKCPDFELDQLVAIRNVTATVRRALAGKTGAAANLALQGAEARIQETCGKDPAVECQVVPLYHGGVYDLYRYAKYTDVRLVFAPEFSVAQFGGDPDNFNFPRYDFDIGLVRAYAGGKPVSSPEYLRWSANGSKPGDLVFVSGNPGRTDREFTDSQLAYQRDHVYVYELPVLAELVGVLEEFMKRGPEQEREAHEDLFYIQNSFKAEFGGQQALVDPAFFSTKVTEERRLRAAVAARPALQRADGSAWEEIANLQGLRAQLDTRYGVTQQFLFQQLTGDAFSLVRAAAERTKPNAARLPEYTDQALFGLQQQLEAPVPIFKDLEETYLEFQLTHLRQDLGADDPLVRKVLGRESPAQMAQRLVSGTHLDAAAVRKSLYDGGQAAIDKSDDPMIRFAASLDADFRAIRKDYETRIDAPTRAAAQRIAKARFAVYGTSVYPDATFTARLSYGTVKGFQDAQGRNVPPYTTMAGLFDRATGAPPFALPASWLDAKSSLDLATPMNLSTTNDIIGGNSGSPLIDRSGAIVGLIFDGNIFSLGGNFGFDPVKNRSVAVDSRALLAGLRNVYHLDRIVSEIEAARH